MTVNPMASTGYALKRGDVGGFCGGGTVSWDARKPFANLTQVTILLSLGASQVASQTNRKWSE